MIIVSKCYRFCFLSLILTVLSQPTFSMKSDPVLALSDIPGFQLHEDGKIDLLLRSISDGNFDSFSQMLDACILTSDSLSGTILHAAVQKRNYSMVKRLLLHGASPNVTSEAVRDEGKTALHMAVERDDCSIIKLLLEAGAYLEAQDLLGRTPLFFANRNTAHFLSKCGAYIAARDSDGKIAPHGISSPAQGHSLWAEIHRHASQGHSQEVAKMIVRADMSMLSAWQNALHAAVAHGHLEAVSILLYQGALPDLPESALCVAARWGQITSAQFLLEKGISVDAQDDFYGSALYEAVTANHPAMVKLLIDAGATFCWSILEAAIDNHAYDALIILYERDKNGLISNNEKGTTPLHYAAERGNGRIVTLLLQNGAALNEFDKQGCSPLHCAALYGELSSMKALLNNGAKVDVQDRFSQTPLHYAAKEGQVEMVRLLLANRASPNMRDNKGRTPLHLAVWKNSCDCISALTEAGADVTVKDASGETAFDLACIHHIEAAKGSLYLAGVISDDDYKKVSVYEAAYNGDIEVLKSFLVSEKKSAFLETFRLIGLHKIATSKRPEAAELLLDYGFDLFRVDERGRTPLHYAVCSNDVAMCQTLCSIQFIVRILAQSRQSVQRLWTVLCCLRRLAPRMPRDLILRILTIDQELFCNFARVLFSGLRKIEKREPVSVIKNETTWMLKIRYDKGNGPIESIIVPGASFILEQNQFAFTCFDLELYGGLSDYVQRKPIDLLEGMRNRWQNAAACDFNITIGGGTGFITQYI